MSRWKDYGFPDPCGVWLQTAFEGLILAALERYRICWIGYASSNTEYFYKAFYANPPRLCGQVFYDIEIIFNELSQGILTPDFGYAVFVLPNGQNFSLENAAAFLGEKLISLPKGTFFNRDWSNPFPALGYEWLTQRYRFLNLLYQLTLPNAVLYGREKTISGWGISVSEAWKNTETEERSVHARPRLQEEISCSKSNWNNYISCKKYIFLPDKIIYPFFLPGRLICTVTADKPQPIVKPANWNDDLPDCVESQEGKYYSKYSFDALGSSLRFKEKKLLFDLPLEKTVGQRTEISLSGVYSAAFTAAFEKASIEVPPDNYENSSITRGFYATIELLCDFRNYLNFYDPISNPGEKQHA